MTNHLGRRNIGMDSNKLNASLNLQGNQSLMPYTTPYGAFAATCSIWPHLPGTRYFYPFYNRDATASQNLSLNYVTGRPTVFTQNSLIPYTKFHPTYQQYLYHTAAGGNVDSGVYDWNQTPGLTIGCWFFLDALGTERGLISNWNDATNDASYRLYVRSTNVPAFSITNTGSYLASNHVPAVNALVAAKWYLAIGRWQRSTKVEIKIWDVDGLVETASKTSSIISSLTQASPVRFAVGMHVDNGSVTRYWDGGIALPFMAVNYHSDTMVDLMWRSSRAMFTT